MVWVGFRKTSEKNEKNVNIKFFCMSIKRYYISNRAVDANPPFFTHTESVDFWPFYWLLNRAY
jgi:predicted RNA methylase